MGREVLGLPGRENEAASQRPPLGLFSTVTLHNLGQLLQQAAPSSSCPGTAPGTPCSSSEPVPLQTRSQKHTQVAPVIFGGIIWLQLI